MGVKLDCWRNTGCLGLFRLVVTKSVFLCNVHYQEVNEHEGKKRCHLIYYIYLVNNYCIEQYISNLLTRSRRGGQIFRAVRRGLSHPAWPCRQPDSSGTRRRHWRTQANEDPRWWSCGQSRSTPASNSQRKEKIKDMDGWSCWGYLVVYRDMIYTLHRTFMISWHVVWKCWLCSFTIKVVVWQ